jgi:hypothetical protein
MSSRSWTNKSFVLGGGETDEGIKSMVLPAGWSTKSSMNNYSTTKTKTKENNESFVSIPEIKPK